VYDQLKKKKFRKDVILNLEKSTWAGGVVRTKEKAKSLVELKLSLALMAVIVASKHANQVNMKAGIGWG